MTADDDTRRPRLARLLGVPALGLATIGLFVTVVLSFLAINERSVIVAQSIREDTLWASYQLDREVVRLQSEIEAVRARPTPEAIEALGTRFDILFSRAGMLTQGHYREKFGGPGSLTDQVREVRDVIVAMAPDFDAIARDRVLPDAAAEELQAELTRLRNRTEALLFATNTRKADLLVAERDRTQRSYLTLGVAMAALTLVLAAVIGLLWKQLRDITRSKRSLHRLSERYAEAARLADAGNKAKSAFLAAMSHEIRTPLNGIVGMVELLDDDSLKPEQVRRIAAIRDCSETLLSLIDDILDYSKLETGSIDLETAPFPLEDTLRSAVRIVADRARAKGLELTVACDPVTVTGDGARIRQVVLNLVANAVKFTPSGSVALVARVIDAPDGAPLLRVAVRDTGIGIAPDAMSRLFRQFTQADATITRRFGGSGLGLAICQKLAHAMGGDIVAESEPGRGSVFTLTVPVGDVAPQAQVAPRTQADDGGKADTAAPSGGRAPAGTSPRVLVVEDNPTNRQVATALLERIGLEADCAADGAEAVAMVRERTYDLVLMDMQMPTMDGLEATRTIRALGLSDVAIVALTANAFVSDREQCLAAGMNDFLAKPINRAKLEAALTAWVPAFREGSARQGHAAVPESPEAAVVDTDQIASMREELGDDTMDAVLTSFWTDVATLVQSLDAALAQADMPALDRGLHSLKGAARTVGFVGIAEAAERARDGIRDGRVPDLGPVQAAIMRARTVDPLPRPARGGAATYWRGNAA